MTATEIQAVRESVGLTVAAFAARLGVTVRTVQYWETGARRPNGSALILIGKLVRSVKPKGKP